MMMPATKTAGLTCPISRVIVLLGNSFQRPIEQIPQLLGNIRSRRMAIFCLTHWNQYSFPEAGITGTLFAATVVNAGAWGNFNKELNMEIIVCIQIILVCIAVNIGVMTYKQVRGRRF